MNSDLVLECIDLQKKYQIADSELCVFQDLQFALQSGEWISIVGASGSGKTTLLNLLGGLDSPSGGDVRWEGKTLLGVTESELGQWRNRYLGVVYQFHHLLPEFTAVENVAMPLWIRGVKKSQALEQAADMLATVGLRERMAHKPAELSGGERQRVAIARALVGSPKVVLLDEPTGNLDYHTAMAVQALIADLNARLGIAFIVVTHDLTFAAKAQTQYHLHQGCLTQVNVIPA